MGDELKQFNPADYKITHYGDIPEREKRKLTPELDKATAAFSPLQTFAKNAVNAATFGQHDRLQSWLSGTNLKDENEFTTRTNEANPKSAFAGGLAGHALQAVPLTAGLAATGPALAANTLRAAAMREGAAGLLSSAGEEGVKVAEGRGKFEPGNIIAGTAAGAVGGGVGSQLPALFGHGKTILSRTSPKPLNEVQRATMDQAGMAGARHGFAGDTGLDLAERARYTADPSLAPVAANIERLKTLAGPSVRAGQETARKAAGLDDITGPTLRRAVSKDPEKLGIRNAIRNAPENSASIPGTFRVGTGIPFVGRSHAVSADIPIPKLRQRYERAATLAQDPAMADIIGRTTGAQAGSAAAGRVGIEELLRVLNMR
jgi:hypothetical protein